MLVGREKKRCAEETTFNGPKVIPTGHFFSCFPYSAL